MVVAPGTVVVVAPGVVVVVPPGTVVVVPPGTVVVVAPGTVVVVPPGAVVVVAPGTVVVAPGIVVVPPGTVVVVGGAHVGLSTVLLSRLTWPTRASRRPVTSAPVAAVIDWSARIVPTNTESVPSVAELPTCQNTLHGLGVLMTATTLPDAVVSAVPILKTNSASGLPWKSRVRAPLNKASEVKQ